MDQPGKGKVECPCCGTIVKRVDPKEAVAYIRLSTMQRKIVNVLVSRFGRPISRAELADRVYDDRPDGGPDTAANILSAQMAHIRKNPEFARLGMAIDAVYGEGVRLRWADE